MRPKIQLKGGRDGSVRRFHPWIFSGAIGRGDRGVKEGEVVDVLSAEGAYLGTGHYLGGSIAVKIFTFQECEVNEAFWREALRSAYRAREILGLTESEETNAYRLVHGEGDNLPGLIIDIYGRVAVMQFQSPGMFAERESFVRALREIYGERLQAVYQKSYGNDGSGDGAAGGEYLWGGAPTDGGEICERGHRFFVDWEHGQKTGFFLDQRENRGLIERLVSGKTVLNTFCYTGGFSVAALAGGAKRVVSVDSSARAMEQLQRNIELNFSRSTVPAEEMGFGGERKIVSSGGLEPSRNEPGVHEGVLGDCFEYLSGMKEEFEVIILDPPAFAKRREAVRSGEKGYTSLNSAALRKLPRGGILATFSCSQLISRVRFRELVFEAAAKARRNVRVIYELRQAPCHPVSIFHPEGEYLKGLVLLVD